MVLVELSSVYFSLEPIEWRLSRNRLRATSIRSDRPSQSTNALVNRFNRKRPEEMSMATRGIVRAVAWRQARE